MRARPDILDELAEFFFQTLAIDGEQWLHINLFREVTLFEISTEVLLDKAAIHMEAAELGSPRQQYLYDAALTFTYQVDGQRGTEKFEELFAKADKEPSLIATRESAVVHQLPDRYLEGRESRVIDRTDNREGQRHEFDSAIEQIRTGSHLGWATHIARIYFALYRDVDTSLSPHQPIASMAWGNAC